MSFVHSHSYECLKSELDIFSLQPTQTSIEQSSWVHYSPVSSLNDESPIQFTIPGSSSDYLDLSHTLLSIRAKIEPTKEVKPEELAADANAFAPVNNLLHSLFQQVDVSLNNKPVSSSSNNYPYRAYVETLLSYGHDAKASGLTASMWYTDTAGYMEAQRAKTSKDPDQNEGLEARLKLCKDKKMIDLIGALHVDLFSQDKLLLNGVELSLRLVRSKDSFCLMQPGEAIGRKISIKEANLIVRRVKISPNLLIAHSKTLANTTAKYPITRVEVKTFTLHSASYGETLDNVIIGQLPKRVIVGFVNNQAYNGDLALNPFNFQHFYLTYLVLYVDGVMIPSKPLTPNFETGSYIQAYHTLFSGTNINFLNEGHLISRESYPLGFTLYAFDLTADQSANCASHLNLVKQGNVRLEVRFARALADTVNALVYAEYDSVIEVDSSRQIAMDYSG